MWLGDYYVPISVIIWVIIIGISFFIGIVKYLNQDLYAKKQEISHVDDTNQLSHHSEKYRNTLTFNTHGITWSYWTVDRDGKFVNPDSIWGRTRLKVIKRDELTCANCGSHLNLTVHHKVSWLLGGTNSLNNLITLCADCHEGIHHKIIYEAEKDFEGVDNYGVRQIASKKVATLRKVINSGGTIRIKYTDQKQNVTNRTIKPEHMLTEHQRTYLVAYCYLRKAGRTFRLSRIKII